MYMSMIELRIIEQCQIIIMNFTILSYAIVSVVSFVAGYLSRPFFDNKLRKKQ